MTDQMTDERAQFEAWLLTEPPYHPNITAEQAGGTKGDDRYLSPSTRFAWSAWKASRLQTQQSDEKLADTQRAIIEAAEARGYRRGIEEAQQPGAQAVAPYGWHCVWRGADGRADWDQFHPSNDPPPTKWDEPPHAIIPLFTHPQPPSIPEPSDEDVEAAWVAFQANIPGNTMRAILSNDRARLRERIVGQALGGDGDA